MSPPAKITSLQRPVFSATDERVKNADHTASYFMINQATLFLIDCVSFILQLRSKQNSLPYYSECCEPCSFCHVNILIQKLIQAFCVFYLYTFYTIGLP